MKDLTSLSVIVTGGGSGIGEATARHLARGGAMVTICGRRADRIEAVAKEIGPRCAWVVADVTKDADRRNLIDTALRHGGRIDAVVSNAGNMERKPVEEWTEERLMQIFNDNVVAGMMLTQLALPHLSASEGSIIFVGSVYTVRAYPGAAPYAATKGALETLTRVLATELGARKIRVNAIRPGAVPTEINVRAGVFTEDAALQRLESMANHHAIGRIGTSLEIAEGIEYLIRAEWVTGSVLAVDGGMGLGVTS
ncbi:MAG: SDR family oxidoreductase [Acidimicrobiia bacterium]|jgi:NAD(P)-dependent dehydrogenase (short-subunit alcohol dehydrogenase family)|nr:SDR family oxidoreductase [Actinomycetota bacterium]NDA77112.1 SDR family oxidoreductase [Actinomycetota bacterium]NDD98067.1 SDR family oxidoreductase [Actinomycetota bacterium]NDE80698.1 SDR family oxidoreductase [Actinomycetota bacterium]NDH47767.1 SDR family oxidoreductase [Acidimicrobiia bacterium]